VHHYILSDTLLYRLSFFEDSSAIQVDTKKSVIDSYTLGTLNRIDELTRDRLVLALKQILEIEADKPAFIRLQEQAAAFVQAYELSKAKEMAEKNAAEKKYLVDSIMGLIRTNFYDRDHAFTLNTEKGILASGEKYAGKKTKWLFRVDSVLYHFNSYSLAYIKAYGKNTENLPVTYESDRKIGVSSFRSLRDFRNRARMVDTQTGSGFDAFSLFSIDPYTKDNLSNFVPGDTVIKVETKNIDQPVRVKKVSVADLIRADLISDASVLLNSQRPNGLFQPEITMWWPLNSRPRKLTFNKSVTLFKNMSGEARFSKIEETNKFLTLSRDPLSGVAHLNNIQMLQFTSFHFGARINLFAIEDKLNSNLIFFNIRYRYCTVPVTDSLMLDSGQYSISNGKVNYNLFDAELSIQKKLTSKVRGIFWLGLHQTTMITSNVEQNNGLNPTSASNINGVLRERKLEPFDVWKRGYMLSFRFVLRYYYGKDNYLFLRATMIRSLDTRNFFSQLQVGYSIPVYKIYQ